MINFGITIANVIPYSISTFLTNVTSKDNIKSKIKKLFKDLLIGGFLILLTSLSQFAISDKPCFKDMKSSFTTDSAPYIERYNSNLHLNITSAFIGNSITMSSFTYKDSTIAIVNDLSIDSPIYIKCIVFSLSILC